MLVLNEMIVNTIIGNRGLKCAFSNHRAGVDITILEITPYDLFVKGSKGCIISNTKRAYFSNIYSSFYWFFD
jgi:hypothetical protein